MRPALIAALLLVLLPMGEAGTAGGAWLLFDLRSDAPTFAHGFVSHPRGGAVISYRPVTLEGHSTPFSCIVTERELGASASIHGNSTSVGGSVLSGLNGVGCGLDLHPDYQYLYVIFAGGFEEWSYDIDAPLIASGPEVLYLEAKDFAEGTGASGAFVLGAANFGLDRGHAFRVENKLIGSFRGAFLLPVYDIRVDGPTSQTCPCTFDYGDFGPGDYGFSWSGAGLEAPGQHPMLFAADVAPIPE